MILLSASEVWLDVQRDGGIWRFPTWTRNRLPLHRHPEMSLEVVVEETLLILQESQRDFLLELVDAVPRGHARIWPNCIWPKPHFGQKSEFGQVIFVTAFCQFQCFSVVACCCLLLLVVACCCLLLLVGACLCLLVPVGACWCLLVPVGACWCLLVPVGACWCLLVPVGACWCLLVCVGVCWCVLVCVCGLCGLCVWWVCVWWVCSRFLGLFPGPPSGQPSSWTAQNFALFSLSRHKIHSFLPSLGGSSRWIFVVQDPQMCTFGLSGCRVKPRRLRGQTAIESAGVVINNFAGSNNGSDCFSNTGLPVLARQTLHSSHKLRLLNGTEQIHRNDDCAKVSIVSPSAQKCIENFHLF